MTDAVIREGQIWKENDKRFTRYVRVLFVCAGGQRVRIQRCLSSGKIQSGARSTEAAASRFGKGYVLVTAYPKAQR